MITHEQTKGKDSVIVFFTGWGCDENCTSHLTSDISDIITVYDFSIISNASILTSKISSYKKAYLVSWSFGVKVASQILPKEIFAKTIAINGTVDLIHKNFGILPEIFKYTLNTISEDNLLRFYKNMTLNYFTLFEPHKPRRSFNSIKNELSFLDKSTIKCDYDFYDEAFVSSRDLIIPVANQNSFWNKKGGINPKLFDAPHYPFFLWDKWEDILNE